MPPESAPPRDSRWRPARSCARCRGRVRPDSAARSFVPRESACAFAPCRCGRAPCARWDGRDALIGALRASLGSVWWTKKEASAALHAAARSAGAPWPSTASHLKAVCAAVSVSDPEGEVQQDKDGNPLPDPDLRDYESVRLDEDIDAYFEGEVRPHVPDAWIDHGKTKTGYEIPFTRHFYVYTPPRPLAEIDAELRDLEAQIQAQLGDVTT